MTTEKRPADVAALTDRCGQCLVGGTTIGTRPAVCALPSGHGVWHRSDEGTEWGFTVRDDTTATLAAARAEGYEAGRADARQDVLLAAADAWDAVDARGADPAEWLRACAEAARRG